MLSSSPVRSAPFDQPEQRTSEDVVSSWQALPAQVYYVVRVSAKADAIAGNRLRLVQGLPAGLHHARDIAAERELPEAKTADAELAQKGARPPAQLAAVMLAALELGFPCIFDALCCGCHSLSLSLPVACCPACYSARSLACSLARLRRLAERDAETLEQRTRRVVIGRAGHDRDIHPLQFLHLRVVNLRKDQLVAHAERVVAPPIKAFG